MDTRHAAVLCCFLMPILESAGVAAHVQQQGRTHLVVVPAGERKVARAAIERGMQQRTIDRVDLIE